MHFINLTSKCKFVAKFYSLSPLERRYFVSRVSKLANAQEYKCPKVNNNCAKHKKEMFLFCNLFICNAFYCFESNFVASFIPFPLWNEDIILWLCESKLKNAWECKCPKVSINCMK